MTRILLIALTLFAVQCNGGRSRGQTSPATPRDAAPRDSIVAPATRHVVDTLLVDRIYFPILERSVVVTCRLLGDGWDKPIYWQRHAINRSDTLWSDSDTCAFFDFQAEITQSRSERDSILEEKKRVLLTTMTTPIEEFVDPSDPRRDLFKRSSLGAFLDHYRRLGISDTSVERIHQAFWNYFKNRDLYIFAFPIPEPPGAETAYTIDPFSHRIVTFYYP